MEILTPPHVEYQPDIPTLGITVTTPFRGMLAVRDQLLAELIEWLNQTRIGAHGPYFLRLHTIDMNGPTKLEVGIRDLIHPGDHRVKPGTMPAGQFASMTYRNHALRANRALLAWITDQGLVPDKNEVPDGDHFGCRCEAYLTDPRHQPRKTLWDVELAIRLQDARP
jgi:effector-binding domain-containing protein